MRKITQVEYVIKKESDIDENLIYAFGNKNDICVLVRKNGAFYWKALTATNMVWYDEYKTIEQAIDCILQKQEYKERNYSQIMEFGNLEDFFNWSLKIIKEDE